MKVLLYKFVIIVYILSSMWYGYDFCIFVYVVDLYINTLMLLYTQSGHSKA